MKSIWENTVIPKILRGLLPLLVSVLAFYYLSQHINFQAVRVAFRQISLITILEIIILFVAGLFLRAACCYVIIDKKLSFRDAFLGMNSGYLLNNILPFRLGEFGRAALLTGRGKNPIGFMEVFASIVTERVLDVFLAAFFFLTTLPFVIASNSLKSLALLMLVLTILAMLAAGLACKNKNKVISFLDARWNNKRERLRKLLPRLSSFLDGFSLLLKPKKFLLALFLLIASWVMSMIMLGLLNHHLLANYSWWWGAFTTSATAFASALPSAPASLGVYEAATVGAYTLLGIGQSSSLVIALIMHGINFVIPSLIGIAGIYLLGETLGSVVRSAAFRKSKTGPEQ